MSRLWSVVAAAAVVVVAASACTSDKPGPNYSSVTPTPSSSTSPTTTPSPSPTGFPTTGPNVGPGETPPTEPASVASNTSTGALAFVGYYVRTLDWVYATSRPDLLSSFYASSCSTCRDGQGFIERLTSLGAITGGRVAVKQIGLVDNDGRGGATFAVSANVSVGAATVIGSSGATATSFPATPDTTLTEWITWDAGHWRIVEERYA